MFWDGKKWVVDSSVGDTNGRTVSAYAKGRAVLPTDPTLRWFSYENSSYKHNRSLRLSSSVKETTLDKQLEICGVPRGLFPYYLSFMFDSMAAGLVMPLLPYFLMQIGANPLQQSLIVSANYVAQMIGCLVMGRISDIYGRKVVLLTCLGASSLSYWCLSQTQSLRMVLLARVLSASCGGLLPVIQSCVADSVSRSADRPKYLGRIMATFGMGFVLGPAIHSALPGFSTIQKMQVAALLPLIGFVVSFIFAAETKSGVVGLFVTKGKDCTSSQSIHDVKQLSPSQHSVPPVSREVLYLVLNGFLNMYAFGTETIYAIFLKDTFGYGESTLGALLVANGVLMGILQVFLIKALLERLGQPATLALGNLLLALGMVGLALVRVPVLHFLLFACHIVGYCIADMALVSAVSRHSPRGAQGRDLALNQAAQACARIFSPVLAGLLYEHSKGQAATGRSWLPVGALPFLVGGTGPLVALIVPVLLWRS